MFDFKNSLIAFAGLILLAGATATVIPLISHGQAQAQGVPQRDPRRLYYLSRDTRTGSSALTGCAAGYHMASLWEIFDTSNLKYNAQLGLVAEDSGFGPPISVNGEGASGWIRTGNDADSGSTAGQANCNAWTLENGETASGTIAQPALDWRTSTTAASVSPWIAKTVFCSSPQHVWCVQD
jgi:hypothetical protein